ncbi:RNase P and RNase MRP subunit [Chytridiales sp. JEL 0842]|nr:RNase P and RNase MRP subunit [Chytridiales sp. JEL 0842]
MSDKKGPTKTVAEDGSAKGAVKFIRNDARAQKSKETSRTVFKTILDTPFVFKWPTLSDQDSSLILSTLCSVLQPIGNVRKFEQERHRNTRIQKTIEKNKRVHQSEQSEEMESLLKMDVASMSLDERLEHGKKLERLKKKEEKAKKRRTEDGSGVFVGAGSDAPSKAIAGSNSSTIETEKKVGQLPTDSEIEANTKLATTLSKGVVVGVNDVASVLESMIARKSKQTPTQPKTPPKEALVVFVCTEDVQPSHLYSHLPSLTYLAGDQVRLCPLPKGAEAAVSNALSYKRVIALAVLTGVAEFNPLIELISSKVEPPNIPWLPRSLVQPASSTSSEKKGSAVQPSLIKTNFKTLKVTVGPRRSRAERREENRKKRVATKEEKQKQEK